MSPLPVTACTSRYSVLEVFLVCFHGLLQTYQTPARGSGVGVSGLTLLPAEQTSQLQQMSRRVEQSPRMETPALGKPRSHGKGLYPHVQLGFYLVAVVSIGSCPIALNF